MIAARLEKLHNPVSEDEQCPGQEACEFYQAGADGFCPVCPKMYSAKAEENLEDAVVNRIQRLIDERNSGKPLNLNELTSEEWELVILWDKIEAAYRRAHEARVTAIFEMFAASALAG